MVKKVKVSLKHRAWRPIGVVRRRRSYIFLGNQLTEGDEFVPNTKSFFICCVDCKLPGVSISDKTLLGALHNRDLECSPVDSIVKEQIRISGDKLYAVTHAYLNMKIAVFWVVSPVCFGATSSALIVSSGHKIKEIHPF
jgi:hypothetical protein